MLRLDKFEEASRVVKEVTLEPIRYAALIIKLARFRRKSGRKG